MSRIRNLPAQKGLRRELRSNGTPSEAVLWTELKSRKHKGRKFRRQDGFGPFVVDFHCPDERLVIEIDGNAHDLPGTERYDERRTAYLERLGVRVIRFDNKAILDDLDAVLEEIARHFTADGERRTELRAAHRAAKA